MCYSLLQFQRRIIAYYIPFSMKRQHQNLGFTVKMLFRYHRQRNPLQENGKTGAELGYIQANSYSC